MVNGEETEGFGGFGGVNFGTSQNFEMGNLSEPTPINIMTGKEDKEKKSKKDKKTKKGKKSFLDRPLVGKKKQRQRTRLGKSFKADVRQGIKGNLGLI